MSQSIHFPASQLKIKQGGKEVWEGVYLCIYAVYLFSDQQGARGDIIVARVPEVSVRKPDAPHSGRCLMDGGWEPAGARVER